MSMVWRTIIYHMYIKEDIMAEVQPSQHTYNYLLHFVPWVSRMTNYNAHQT